MYMECICIKVYLLALYFERAMICIDLSGRHCMVNIVELLFSAAKTADQTDR